MPFLGLYSGQNYMLAQNALTKKQMQQIAIVFWVCEAKIS